MSRRKLWRLGLAGFGLIAFAVAAFGIASMYTYRGTVDNYALFHGPATVEIQSFNMKPGDVFPWHYHEGLSYVILLQGTLTVDDGCGNVHEAPAGTAFVEEPGHVHQVSDQSHGAVIAIWATIYRQGGSDGYFVDPPTCP